jgi:chromosome segregation ATPase
MGEGEWVSSRADCTANAYPYLIFLVASDFGGIFAELLPGNFSKLQPPDNQDLMDGLEIKVQLGSVWKQSLTELSGGQRYVCPPSNPLPSRRI